MPEITVMHYSILWYKDEMVTVARTKAYDDAAMAKLEGVTRQVAAEGKLGPAVRLLPTTTATTLRQGRSGSLVIDGPFAETTEQLVGFYIVDCVSLDEVLAIAEDLANANPGGALEIRPVGVYFGDPRPAP